MGKDRSLDGGCLRAFGQRGASLTGSESVRHETPVNRRPFDSFATNENSIGSHSARLAAVAVADR